MKITNLQPPIYLGLCLFLAFALFVAFPGLNLIAFPFNLLGLAPVLAGFCLNLKSDRLFKIHKTTVKPKGKSLTLMTEGPFSASRHPMYLGFILILLGTAFLLGNLASFLSPLLMFYILAKYFVPMEEEKMEKAFGQKYRRYCQKVKRWF